MWLDNLLPDIVSGTLTGLTDNFNQFQEKISDLTEYIDAVLIEAQNLGSNVTIDSATLFNQVYSNIDQANLEIDDKAAKIAEIASNYSGLQFDIPIGSTGNIYGVINNNAQKMVDDLISGLTNMEEFKMASKAMEAADMISQLGIPDSLDKIDQLSDFIINGLGDLIDSEIIDQVSSILDQVSGLLDSSFLDSSGNFNVESCCAAGGCSAQQISNCTGCMGCMGGCGGCGATCCSKCCGAAQSKNNQRIV